MEGKLRKVYKDLQYGFIQAGDTSYFLHKSDYNGNWIALCNEFEGGTPIHIEFEHSMTDKGLRAKEAKLSEI